MTLVMLGDRGFVARHPRSSQTFEHAGFELRLIRRNGKDAIGRN